VSTWDFVQTCVFLVSLCEVFQKILLAALDLVSTH